MTVVAEHLLDLSFSDEKVRARIHEPVQVSSDVWTSLIEIGPPFNYRLDVYGEDSLQALTLAVSVVSITLYSAGGYRYAKELGWNGVFGGDLGLPAPESYQDFAPYRF